MIQTICTSKFLRILKILMLSCQELGREVMGCFIQEYHEQHLHDHSYYHVCPDMRILGT